MKRDKRKNRKKKVSGGPISIKPVDKVIWQILHIYYIRINQENSKNHLPRITKGELIEKILKDYLKEKYDNKEFEDMYNKLNELLKKKRTSKKNK